mmetsp:Transcript_16459/g.45612  ORF Transcript_16459/g.45612 Transcript_16459/m.45612 type:complete len:212 (-) Transcript_16459:772-1407(-)
MWPSAESRPCKACLQRSLSSPPGPRPRAARRPGVAAPRPRRRLRTARRRGRAPPSTWLAHASVDCSELGVRIPLPNRVLHPSGPRSAPLGAPRAPPRTAPPGGRRGARSPAEEPPAPRPHHRPGRRRPAQCGTESKNQSLPPNRAPASRWRGPHVWSCCHRRRPRTFRGVRTFSVVSSRPLGPRLQPSWPLRRGGPDRSLQIPRMTHPQST